MRLTIVSIGVGISEHISLDITKLRELQKYGRQSSSNPLINVTTYHNLDKNVGAASPHRHHLNLGRDRVANVPGEVGDQRDVWLVDSDERPVVVQVCRTLAVVEQPRLGCRETAI